MSGHFGKKKASSAAMKTHNKYKKNDDEIDEMFAKVDADGSGEIEYSEFVVATMNEKNLLSNNKL